ncbi:cyclic nucleotide-binding domain-containing protein [Pedobacter sp. ISL-68]|uniref:Crp/Fnr family transcriptional regulator n=1 Tax=unclassified Pedobacter TaxID=2628915 RepID=UPI001BE9676A|nr:MULTISPECIES: cyclic nucleotide-binding domain-containing protein [unclassified Pedobacter]MBT2563751.1 cyclic nucleotide-binding domain-containing protein [Pedobacter sp. ISL-64]MBT2589643.1 cyclic nucleotide-binding domain-containing protein [Pedobacter sp. ISL-68]
MVSHSELEALLATFGEHYRPTPSEIEQLRSSLVPVRYNRGELVQKAGTRSSRIWFLQKGFAREITIDPDTGTSRTTWFWFTADFLFGSPFLFSRQPSFTHIEAITDCTMLELSYAGLLRLKDRSWDMELVIERMRAKCEMERSAYASDLILLSSKERYLKYYNLHRELFNVAKHKDIAIFLGIKDDGFNRFNA